MSNSSVQHQRRLYPPSRSSSKMIRQPIMEHPYESVDTEETWHLTTADCSHCKVNVSCRLLFVCRKKSCPDRFKEPKEKISTPKDFYTTEKVFCSKCAFRGIHKEHADYMEGADRYAIRFADGNKEAQESFRKLAFIDHEDPVDFIIVNKFNTKELPILPVHDYLANSKDCRQWEARKQELDECHEKVLKCRDDGFKFASAQAENALIAIKSLVDMVEEDLGPAVVDPSDNQKPIEIKKRERTRSDSSYSSLGGSDSDTEREAIKQEEKKESTEKDKTNDKTVTMMCRNLTLHFEEAQDKMNIEDALYTVSEKLSNSFGTRENKFAAAKMFKEKTNYTLAYSLEYE